MFDHFVWSVVVVPPLLVLAVRLLADRLAPSAAARAIAWSAAVAAACSTLDLALFAVHAAAELPVVGRFLGISAAVVARDTEAEPWVSDLSVVLLIAVPLSVLHRWRRQRRLLRLMPATTAGQLMPVPDERPATATGQSVEVPDERPAAGGEFVLVPDEQPAAFAVPPGRGRTAQVVVTTGMRDRLTDRQFEALLAHERAHLAEGHHRLVRIAELAVAAHPALWWVGRHVDYLVERAADERAADALGSRRTVAHAIGAAALAGGPRAASGTLHAAAGGVVPRRVSRLLAPPASVLPAILVAVPLLVALSSIVWTGEATLDLVELIASAAR